MKKRGFTLIELLAVIVILAIIALIATPIVMNIIENFKMSAAQQSAENIEKAAELYYYNQKLDGGFPGITFTCNGENCSSNDKILQINGKIPEVGTISIDSEGVITLNSIVINKYNCYKETESYKCDKVEDETVSSTNGTLILDSKIPELLNYKIYGNSAVEQKGLPLEYQPVEYIISTGKQYIDTGLVGKPGYTIETDLAFPELATGSYQYFAGYSYTGSADRIYFIRLNNSTSHLGYTYGSNARSKLLEIEENVFYNIKSVMKTNKQELFVNGESISSSTYGTLSYDEENPKNIYMFISQYTSGTNGGTGAKCKGAKWYDENDNLVRDFIPCYRKSDGEVGMYDLVNGKFYTNQGTGDFEIGELIAPTEIESVGNYNSATGLYEIPIKVTGKNLWKHGDVSVSVSNTYALKNTLLAGETYTISALVTSTDTDATSCLVYDEINGVVLGTLKRGERSSRTFTPTKNTNKIILYASTSYTDGVGDTATFENVQIEKGAATSYEPYKENNYTISLTEPLRKLDDYVDYIDFRSGKIIRNVKKENDGSLVGLKNSVSEDIDLSNIKINKGINNIFVETNIKPSKIEMEYYK